MDRGVSQSDLRLQSALAKTQWVCQSATLGAAAAVVVLAPFIPHLTIIFLLLGCPNPSTYEHLIFTSSDYFAFNSIAHSTNYDLLRW